MTARRTSQPNCNSAVRRNSLKMTAATSCGSTCAPPAEIAASPRVPSTTSNSKPLRIDFDSSKDRPINRFALRTVSSGNSTAFLRASAPTSTAKPARYLTTDASMRSPASLERIRGPAASQNATSECVVPKSIPTIGSDICAASGIR